MVPGGHLCLRLGEDAKSAALACATLWRQLAAQACQLAGVGIQPLVQGGAACRNALQVRVGRRAGGPGTGEWAGGRTRACAGGRALRAAPVPPHLGGELGGGPEQVVYR